MADAGKGPSEPRQSTAESASEQMVADVFERMIATARTEAVFTPPQTVDGRTVILAADVMCGLGFGSGGGHGPEGTGSGRGAGGGGGARSRPVAAIISSPEGIEIKPIVDATRIVLAAVATAGFMLVWLLRLLRLGQGAETREMRRSVSPGTFRKLIRTD